MDYRLYFITADNNNLGRTHLDTAEAAVLGGATTIQFRDKDMDDREFERTARQVKNISGRYGVPLIINDRSEIAVKIGAAGVHVGQDDLDAASVRALIGPDLVLGCSVTTADQARQAEKVGADYIGAGPVFPTGSKNDAAPPIGLDGLIEICRAVAIPVVAIGGITVGNINEVIETGAAGTAVIAAIAAAPNMKDAAAELLNRWEKK
jgi:thiamine-phosphate pyrophosphorylase